MFGLEDYWLIVVVDVEVQFYDYWYVIVGCVVFVFVVVNGCCDYLVCEGVIIEYEVDVQFFVVWKVQLFIVLEGEFVGYDWVYDVVQFDGFELGECGVFWF